MTTFESLVVLNIENDSMKLTGDWLIAKKLIWVIAKNLTIFLSSVVQSQRRRHSIDTKVRDRA